MQSHVWKVHACSAVTSRLRFWQNDWDLLRATAVTRGWNGYRNKSQHRKLTMDKTIFPPLLLVLEPATFWWRVRRCTTELYPHTPSIAFRHLPPRRYVVNKCLEFATPASWLPRSWVFFWLRNFFIKGQHTGSLCRKGSLRQQQQKSEAKTLKAAEEQAYGCVCLLPQSGCQGGKLS